MYHLVAIFLLHLLLVQARVDKCGTLLLENCFCGNQYEEDQTLFVVNCTGHGFTNTAMLKVLPEDTEKLIFTGNHVGTLESNLFGDTTYLKKLRIIDMTNNGIHDIKGKAFHHVPNVTRLILNHNNLSISVENNTNYLHPRVFSNLYNLQELHLTNAFADNTVALAHDLHEIFVNSNLTRLYKLHLEQNEIKNFKDDRVFCDLPDLHDLYLGDNNIPRLNFNITCLPKLRFIDLEGNNITMFTLRDLDNFDRLAQPYRQQNLMIEMRDNPFRCDTAIQTLYTWLHKTNVTVRNAEKLECHQEKWGTKYILSLKNLAESKHAKISQALTVLLIILVLILITLLGAYVYLKKNAIKSGLGPIFDVTRKVQYTTIESQDV